jgi:uncharacterized RDD family membrane protein YckC
MAIFLLGWIASIAFKVSDVEKISGDLPRWAQAVMIISFFLIIAGYFVFFETFWNGQTPGKRLMKLRVIREDGRPITFWEAAARNLIRILDMMPAPGVPFYSVGLISVFMNDRDQRVGDLFAGTVVVRERQDEAPAFKEVFNARVSDSALRRLQKKVPFTGSITDVTESEIEVVENFLRRRDDLSEKQRLWMAWRVALPIMFKIKPQYDVNNFSYEGFLEELLHRYHSRQNFSR